MRWYRYQSISIWNIRDRSITHHSIFSITILRQIEIGKVEHFAASVLTYLFIARRVTLFWPKTVVASFLRLIVFVCKAFNDHLSKGCIRNISYSKPKGIYPHYSSLYVSVIKSLLLAPGGLNPAKSSFFFSFFKIFVI